MIQTWYSLISFDILQKLFYGVEIALVLLTFWRLFLARLESFSFRPWFPWQPLEKEQEQRAKQDGAMGEGRGVASSTARREFRAIEDATNRRATHILSWCVMCRHLMAIPSLCKIKTNQREKAKLAREREHKFKMSKKTKKKGGKPSSDRLVMKAKQSKEMKAKVNPFERNFTKEKHKVFNR